MTDDKGVVVRATHPQRNRAMDDTDIKIIEALRADGRMSNVALARRVGVSEPTVRKRLKGLVDSGRMQVVAVVSPYRVGFIIHANIGLDVEPSLVMSVADTLVQMAEVRYVGVSTGAYDLIIGVLFRSNEELFSFLTVKLAGIPGVRKTETSHILKVLKRTYDWVRPDDEAIERPRVRDVAL